ncbi:hypothetical protein LMF32_00950 [Desemzia sp. C1]|uniref:hypothetical protein n=1 Tax=unclassified Desemzia TaxID=2685243 RepID=UPI001E412A78|nr:hypothetical protein [Desemzia sp. C1]MCI3027704.1 hypothetical protein [Desemzia sp. C1]
MEFEKIDSKELEKMIAENAILVVSKGSVWVKKLPEFGETKLNLVSQNGHVQYIDDVSESRTKLQ